MKIEWKKETIEEGICSKMEDVPKGAKVEMVDGKDVITICEACRKFIFEYEEYVSTEDPVDLCIECAEALKEGGE